MGVPMNVSAKRVAGLVALVAVAAMGTACVFDSGGDYKSGGRNSPVKKEDNDTPTLTLTFIPTPTPTPTPTPSTPPVDAATG